MVCKIFTIGLILSICSIFLFSFIYYHVEHIRYIDAFYESTMIQTLVGVDYPLERDASKVFASIQAFVSYAFTAGFIVIILKKIHKRHK